MSEPAYRAAIIEFIERNANPPDKFSHQARLYALAVELAEGKPFDDEVVFAAAWMHDLGVFVGHRPEDPPSLAAWDHLAYVLQQAPSVLADVGFPAEKISAVLEAIRTHMPASDPGTFEGVLVRDADILEQLGAVGILRTVSKVGRDTRFTRFSDALAVLRRNLEELPGKLRLESARKRAQARRETLRHFLDAASAETGSIAW
jgi:uncharacterized protein